MHRAYGELADLLQRQGFWMGWNTVLAFVPLGLAYATFRPGRRLNWSFWAGTAAFLAFLPNAPYPISDLIHYLDEVRSGDSNAMLLGVTTPVYALFVAVAFMAYVLCLRRVCAFVASRRERPNLAHLPIEFGLHAACSVGIYLGREIRLNSWDVVVDPGSVAASLDSMSARYPVLFCGALFVVLCIATVFGRIVLEGLELRARRVVKFVGVR